MVIKSVCNSCGASALLEENSIGECEYCGSILSSNIIKPVSINLEEKFEKSVKLFAESFDYGILDITLLELSLSSLIEIFNSNLKNRLWNKIKIIINSQNNFDEVFLKNSIETIQNFKKNNEITSNNQLEFLKEVQTLITVKFKYDYLKNIEKEYDYYFDERFTNLNDIAFQNKKNQVKSLYNQKEKEVTEILTLIETKYE